MSVAITAPTITISVTTIVTMNIAASFPAAAIINIKVTTPFAGHYKL